MNFRKLLARPELGACFATILIFIVFAAIAGKQGFLSAQGTINYLEVGAARAEDTLALVRAVNRAEVRLMLDLYHARFGDGILIALLREAIPWIGEIQLADVLGR